MHDVLYTYRKEDLAVGEQDTCPSSVPHPSCSDRDVEVCWNLQFKLLLIKLRDDGNYICNTTRSTPPEIF